MFFDARSNISALPSKVDICVIGAGVAGLVLARRLEGSGLSVWLFESGGRRFDRSVQALNAGLSNLADYPFLSSRVRIFGGTSTRWTGACIRLDGEDFEERAWLSRSGWPFGLSELATYYELAQEDFGISGIECYEADINRSPFNTSDLQAKAVAYSAPLNLGKRYQNLIASSDHLHCFLYLTAIEVCPDTSGTRVKGVTFVSPSGDHFEVEARAVVLACGGIENARLLLASDSIHVGGLGNVHDVLGRYHMEHPIRSVGILPIATRAADALPFTNRVRCGSSEFQGTFGLSPHARNREQVLDLHVRAYRYNTLEDSDPVIHGKMAASGLFDCNQRPIDVARHALAACRPSVFRYLAWHLKNKLWRGSAFDHIRLTAFIEQEPDPNNRITLASERDANGRPLPFLIYRESEKMTKSINRTMHVMAAALRQAGFGNLIHGEESLGHLAHYHQYGLHQMGSTRMSDNPKQGVVDRDCRVHGFSNLFVTGSSVFPTGGAANPTWTIAALALRLADCLKRDMPAL